LPVGTARLGALGWAGENEGLLEHPEVITALAPNGNFLSYFWHQLSCSPTC